MIIIKIYFIKYLKNDYYFKSVFWVIKIRKWNLVIFFRNGFCGVFIFYYIFYVVYLFSRRCYLKGSIFFCKDIVKRDEV